MFSGDLQSTVDQADVQYFMWAKCKQEKCGL